MTQLQPHLGSLLFLLLAVFAVYGRLLGHEFLMTWDDSLYVVNNEAVKGLSWQHVKAVFSSYYVGNYAPVQMLSYMLDYELWGMKAGGFLFANIIVHTLNGLLIYRLLLRCHDDRLVATIGAAFFLLHPVQVESVAWISERKNLLAMFFFLLAWEGYCRYRVADDGKGIPAYTASMAAFIIALLAKSVAVIFPVVILMYDFCYPVKTQRIRLWDKVPYILASVIVAALAVQSQIPVDDGWGGGGNGGGLTGYHGGSALATFLSMLTVFCRYIGMLVWPAGLSAAYEPVIHQSIDLTVIAAAFILIGISFLSIRLFRVNRKVGFWPVVFFIGLLPVSQIVPLITLMNDRYLYFPMLGAAALVGCGASYLYKRLRSWQRVPFFSCVTLLLILLSVVSFYRAAIWQNDITFGRDTVAKCPSHYAAWEGLGEAYYFSIPPRNNEAVQAYSRALELDPESKPTLYNLGVLYVERGDYDKGYELLSKLVYLYKDHAVGWAYLGDIYMHRQDYAEAEKSYKQALTLIPNMKQAIFGLGNLSIIKGHLDQALNNYSRIESMGDNDPDLTYQLARVESLAGHRDEALMWMEKALQRGYHNYNNLLENKELSAIRESPRFAFLQQQYFPVYQRH